MSIIYRITCTANGKFYIGSTMNKAQRWARHRKELRAGVHVNKNMQASWNKYGEASFVFEVLEEVENVALLLVAEQRYLDEVVGKDECFNWAKFAGAPMRGMFGDKSANKGRHWSEETKAKISAGVSGEKHPNWGRQLSEETKQKIRESNLAFPHRDYRHTPEAIAKIAAASKGRPVSEETRAKRSKALKGREVSAAQRAQISRTLSGEGNFWYGKKRSAEFVAKVSRPVNAIRPDGTVLEYTSIQALREDLGLKPPTVNRALKSGIALVRGPLKGWKFVDACAKPE